MRGGAAVVCLVVVWLLAPGEASAKRLTDVDGTTGVAFALDGRALTATLTPGPHPIDVRGELYGKQVTAACATSYGPFSRVVRKAIWPADVNSVTFTFDRDISEDVSWCLLEEETGGDIAEAAFGPIPGLFFALTDYINGAKPRGVRRYLRVRDASGKIVISRRGGRLPLRLLRPGRYTVISFQRSCQGGCRRLGPVRLRCARRFRIRARDSLAALVLVDVKRGRCRISFKAGD